MFQVDEKPRDVKIWASELLSHLMIRARADAWLYFAVAFYFLGSVLLITATGHAEVMSFSLYFDQWTFLFLIFMPLTAVVVDYAWVIFRFEGKRALVARKTFSPQRLAHLFSGMALLMALMIFQGTFTSIKNLLPILRGGFVYDHMLANADALLSFGSDPSKILQSIGVVGIMDWNYSILWFILCFGTLFFVATSPRAASIRVRYISMFMFVWVFCGNILAGFFMSAGPAFYGAATGDHERFAALQAFLSSPDGPLLAHSFQTYLWSLHQAGTSGLGSGISAFPSVHVGLIALNAFFAIDLSRRFGVLAFCYTAFVMLSSVCLGWHYAVDGYASLILVGAAHYGVKAVMERRPTLSGTPDSVILAP
ncbi:hypothetical protein FZ934_10080 [Rhizobium grahamii]|uniref:Inositolphosphotransferase Aur1/Ipt1 domain-containing protein n=1 Tax=Rhizobium grahamii TaxID=1120045 RepID=A0A5Q0C4D6_9HYPH|nr:MULTISPECIES: phosphatase PAP2 family protein [Rhizobium]QFY60736.1 hypothetical protein FZ934_10080 [Rhizobium grahamii]QRM50123.1 hypothetical protein F3Y33_12810 [Rhizobium sp. BG6]